MDFLEVIFFLLSKLDSPVIKTLGRHFFTLNVLITREFNFDERNEQLIRGSFLKK